MGNCSCSTEILCKQNKNQKELFINDSNMQEDSSLNMPSQYNQSKISGSKIYENSSNNMPNATNASNISLSPINDPVSFNNRDKRFKRFLKVDKIRHTIKYSKMKLDELIENASKLEGTKKTNYEKIAETFLSNDSCMETEKNISIIDAASNKELITRMNTNKCISNSNIEQKSVNNINKIYNIGNQSSNILLVNDFRKTNKIFHSYSNRKKMSCHSILISPNKKKEADKKKKKFAATPKNIRSKVKNNLKLKFQDLCNMNSSPCKGSSNISNKKKNMAKHISNSSFFVVKEKHNLKKKERSSHITTSNISNISQLRLNDKDTLPDNFYSNLEIHYEEEKEYLNNIRKNILFEHLPEKIFNYLMDKSEGIECEKDFVIYEKGDKGKLFFIIKEGEVEVSTSKASSNNINQILSLTHKSCTNVSKCLSNTNLKENTNKKILKVGEYFGELALFYSDVIRENTVKTLTKARLISIKGKYYRKSIKEIKTNPFDNVLTRQKESVLFRNIESDLLIKICLRCKIRQFKINEIIMSSKKQDFIVIINKGDAIITYKDGNTKVLRESKFYGHINVLLNYIDENFIDIKAINECEVYIIDKDSLMDILGADFQKFILIQMFIYAINNNNYFKNIFNDRDSQENFFELFNKTHYKNGEIVYDISQKTNKKIIFLLNGTLYFKEKSYFSSKLNIGEIYGDDIINKNEDLNSPITANGSLIVLEAEWKSIYNLINKNYIRKSSYYDLMRNQKYLSKCYLLNSFTEPQLLEFSNMFSDVVKYKKTEKIIKKGEKVDKLIYIIKGTVLLKYKDININKEIDESNFICVESIINDTSIGYTVECLTETQIIYLEKSKFLEFIEKYDKIKEEITNKFQLNDMEVQLKDLYKINNQLVHNGQRIYTIKSQKINNNIEINENIILQKIHHPFIINYIKTYYSSESLINLFEFVNGKTLSEYIKTRPKSQLQSKKDIVFFGSSLMVILNYLHKKLIIHRDINPYNILINEDGYIKLTNFSNSKIVKDFTYTITGLPVYMAPEVIMGKGYGFTCDYWSVGVCLYFLYYGYLPFDNIDENNLIHLYKEIVSKKIKFPPNNDKDSLLVFDFLKKLLIKEPSIRLGSIIPVIKNENLFKNFSWQDLQTMKLDDELIPFKKTKYEADELSKFLKNIYVPYLRYNSQFNEF